MRTTLYTTLTSTSVEKHTLGLAPEAAVASVSGQRSPWHSPVPYLFGGLAAMLGLIAFALLILACSYWRLSRNQDSQQDNEEGDMEKGDGFSKMKGVPVFEEKIVVIMAGNDKPTFLATPTTLIFSEPTGSNDLMVGSVASDGAKESTSSADDDDKTKEVATQYQS